MRGKHATKPMESVLAEAQQLADHGVRELIIVAQDTTYYGMDLYGEPRLAELLEKLNQVNGLDWIRLMYFYPMYIDDDLLKVIAASDKILPYIDMPLQHADDVMLKRMSRRVNHEQTEQQIVRMREVIPDLVLRTTFITGFPGETDQQFESLVEFTRRHKFERMGVFTYSFEPDTPAAKMEGHLDEEIKNRRRDRLMEVQQEIMFEFNQNQIGRTIDVMIDQPVSQQPGAWIGRSAGDAPDVDSVVFVTETEHPLAARSNRCLRSRHFQGLRLGRRGDRTASIDHGRMKFVAAGSPSGAGIPARRFFEQLGLVQALHKPNLLADPTLQLRELALHSAFAAFTCFPGVWRNRLKHLNRHIWCRVRIS